MNENEVLKSKLVVYCEDNITESSLATKSLAELNSIEELVKRSLDRIVKGFCHRHHSTKHNSTITTTPFTSSDCVIIVHDQCAIFSFVHIVVISVISIGGGSSQATLHCQPTNGAQLRSSTRNCTCDDQN